MHWEEEKEKMFASARAEAENIVQSAQQAASSELQIKTDEAQVIKQQAEEEAEKIISNAQNKAKEIENEMRQSIETERKEVRDSAREEGHEAGFASGREEVNYLIERTHSVLKRAQDKRAEILSETEQQIIDLVLLISRKVIKVISETQRNIIITNVIEALRKIKSKGDIIIRVNVDDLKLATEHKQEFVKQVENAKSVQVIEDSSIDSGGCIIETDFGEIDARIASQLTELENKILEISPIKSLIKGNLPPPVVRTANLNADIAASASLINSSNLNLNSENEAENEADAEDGELSNAANAALTASAALAALATMATKGKREADKKITDNIELGKRKTDS
jgi:flagellar assembly protein FliH